MKKFPLILLFILSISLNTKAQDSLGISLLADVFDFWTGTNMAFSGNLAFVTTGQYLRVFDISQPEEPVQRSKYLKSVRAVCVDEDYLYMYNKDCTFSVARIDDEIEVIAEIATDLDRPSKISTMIKYGHYIMVSYPFAIIDVSDIENMEVISEIELDWGIRDFIEFDHFLYAIARSEVYVFDLSSMENVELIDTLELPGTACDIELFENYAVISCIDRDQFGVQILDITNPENIEEVVFFSNDGDWDLRESSNLSIVIQDGTLLLWENCFKLWALDISDPANPAHLSMHQYQFPEDFCEWIDGYTFPYFYNDYIFVLHDLGMMTVSINELRENRYFDFEGIFSGGSVGASLHVDNKIFAAFAECSQFGIAYGLALINIQDPFNPGIITSDCFYQDYPDIHLYFDMFNNSDGSLIIVNYECLWRFNYYAIYRFEEPDNLEVLFDGAGCEALELFQDRFLFMRYGNELQVMDIINPERPTRICRYPWSIKSFQIDHENDLLIVLSNESLITYNLDDLQNPEELSRSETGGLYSIILDNNLIFGSHNYWDDTIHDHYPRNINIYDFADRNDPELLLEIETPYRLLKVVDNLIFAGYSSWNTPVGFIGLQILDYSDLDNIEEVGFSLSGSSNVEIVDTLLFAATGRSIEIYDITRAQNFNHPPLISNAIEPPDSSLIVGDSLILRWNPAEDRDNDELNYTLSLTIPTSGGDSTIHYQTGRQTEFIIEDVREWRLQCNLMDSVWVEWWHSVSDGFNQVRDPEHRLFALPQIRLDSRDEPIVLEEFSVVPYPNPFNSTLQVNLTLSHAGLVNIGIYTVDGRKVEAVLTDRNLHPGQHKFIITPSGLAAGVYLLCTEYERPSSVSENGYGSASPDMSGDVRKLVYLE